MDHERPTPAAPRMPADPSGRGGARSLPGLIDVLDRVDDGLPRRRPLPRHAAAARAVAYRSGGVVARRSLPAGRGPLRTLRPAPPARPAPVPFRAAPQPAEQPAVETAVAPPAGRPDGLTRRAALWGSGPEGAVLAWRSSMPVAVAARPLLAEPLRRDRPGPSTPGLLGALRRRAALWGAGPNGENLAWSRTPLARAAIRLSGSDVDAPVVLGELASTPTTSIPTTSTPTTSIPTTSVGTPQARVRRAGAPPAGLRVASIPPVKPATPSPVPALVPGPAPSPAEPVAPPAPIGHRAPAPPVVGHRAPAPPVVGHRAPAPPVAEGGPTGPRVPVPSARTPRLTGRPHRPLRSSSRPARSFPTASGPVRARGDPPPGRARGSPRPPRRMLRGSG